MSSAVVVSFAPISAPNARLLILGSMPGAASLAAGQYYAHPRNAFWHIMGDLLGAGPDRPYEERVQILKARGVAVWDVLQACIRPGSLDADIRDEVPNDFASFFDAYPHITHIGLNGGKAAQIFEKYAARYSPPGMVATRLPSTSPAHAALNIAAKSAIWRAALPPLD